MDLYTDETSKELLESVSDGYFDWHIQENYEYM